MNLKLLALLPSPFCCVTAELRPFGDRENRRLSYRHPAQLNPDSSAFIQAPPSASYTWKEGWNIGQKGYDPSAPEFERDKPMRDTILHGDTLLAGAVLRATDGYPLPGFRW